MFRSILKSSTLQHSICSSCYRRQSTTMLTRHYNTFFTQQQKKILLQQQPQPQKRLFHSSRPIHSPIIPIPVIILSALKTGKLVSLVSLSSKTSLTLLPHTFRRGSKGDKIAKILAAIPLFGFTLLLVVGLDQAPNTSRLRLIYLSEDEESEIVEAEIDALLEAQSGLVAPKDSEVVMWLQTIVDNLAAAAVDDIREPVRHYSKDDNAKSRQIIGPDDKTTIVPVAAATGGEVDVLLTSTNEEVEDERFRPAIPTRNFEVHVIWDSTTINAMCAGSRILVYNLLMHYMEYDTTRLAVILSHEIAHSIQRHFVEQHGFASLMFMLGDITRGVFWMVTESLGPYVNQKINEYISTFITLETQTTYNRRLEKEADLVGLRILAKAGYDPRVAIDVWERMADLEKVIKKDAGAIKKKEDSAVVDRALQVAKRSIAPPEASVVTEKEEKYEDLEYGIREFLDALVNSWFGSSHPPTLERIEYMRENMEEAVLLYDEALKLNGPPTQFIFSEDLLLQQQQKQQQTLQLTDLDSFGIFARITQWLSNAYHWNSSNKPGSENGSSSNFAAAKRIT